MHTYVCIRFSVHFPLLCLSSGTYSLFFCFSHFISLPIVFLCFFSYSPSFCLPLFLSHTQTLKWLFLAGWVWKCAMINMLPWLFILSNGSVKLQCVDKYRRWRNIVVRRRDTMKQAAGAYGLQQRESCCCIQGQIQDQQPTTPPCVCQNLWKCVT